MRVRHVVDDGAGEVRRQEQSGSLAADQGMVGRVFLAGDYLQCAEMEEAAVTGLEAVREIRRRLGAG